MPTTSAATFLPPRQRLALRRLLLNQDVKRCSGSVLSSLLRRGLTRGDAGGHALTARGRAVAEATAGLSDDAWVSIDPATGEARCVPRPPRPTG